ncbi:hypothetical protein BE25_0227 [Staphylococcus phage vB_SepM_BE25]|uniref:Uncharacterized protein n=3 Tax=Sepunavirus TaxID=1980928 RepID=W5R9X3_9CAUD|nr:hypothetical protein FDH45_gp129 [Staphylococcus phage phiIBB-SEP1]QLF86735.1 hypothetical protein BESEP4_00001 [Staphylococcus phage vB_SepM_BE04]QLF87124.1 hypothetical protein BESEP5_00182 [Staphylococcus phage vB_SepM_BE05]WEU70713.1 hypothetical protein BE25_0227 [Staphylococcus phage vB_SepM_BE25]WJJ57914.1 hypothetical protein 80A_00135 [Staphylococcus phage 80A]WJJ58108.1 hypothetical protein 80B_00136 [Staphylococcus phage 80B]
MIEVVKKKSTRPLQDGDLLYESDLDMYGFIIKEDTSNYESIYNVMLLDTNSKKPELYFSEPITLEEIEEFGFNLVSKKGNYNIKIEYS